jgi:hypothetical protein
MERPNIILDSHPKDFLAEAHLAFINSDSDAIKGIKNTRPHSGGNGETFVYMMVNHRNQGESPSIKVYECI